MPFILCGAIFKSMSIILQNRPDVIVGFGGYVTFSVLLSGWLLRIPIVLHEQNSIAGLSNKVLAKLANSICVAFDGVLPSR
jgi:UDP-N-acetylglucosamine--N-acetylmuramyl-(pentapeptide) pyrophosphoryl-undecaprenol N-acetylglucosamine transferase